MQQAGSVLHLARSGRLILKAISSVRDGAILVDETGRRTCKVIETIGPVSSPYLSAQPLTDRIERVIGKDLFVDESRQFERKGKGPQRSRSGNGRARPSRPQWRR